MQKGGTEIFEIKKKKKPVIKLIFCEFLCVMVNVTDLCWPIFKKTPYY